MIPLALRVARRVVNAAFFNVGDIILFGKYKNKKGKIIAFGKNDKGQPTVEIEPIPKGRKKNKVMGLFKIWNVSKKEEALAEKQMEEEKAKQAFKSDGPNRKGPMETTSMDHLAPRVAEAYVKTGYVGIGQEVESGSIRIKRWRDILDVTDLTNAGKRGKKVEQMSIEAWPDFAILNGLSAMLQEYKTYDSAVATVKDWMVDYPTAIKLHFSQKRGVDVTPAGFSPVVVEGKKVYVSVGYKTFTVRDLEDLHNEPRCIPAIKGGLKAIPVFYRWVKDNESKVKRMSFNEVTKAMGDLGIPFHQYCAMD